MCIRDRYADELEIKYHQEAAMSIAADGPSFAEPATHPRGRPPPCTSDEYVEYPFARKWNRQMPHAHGSNKIEIHRKAVGKPDIIEDRDSASLPSYE